MTSRNLFFKRMKQDIEQRIWLPILFFIIGFLVLELDLVSRIDVWQGRDEFAERINRYLLENLFSPFQDFFIVTCSVALLCAISGFSYMHSAKKLDVYHSIPIKREHLFGQQYVYGVLYYVIPMVLHMIICLTICGINGVLGADVLGQALGFFWIQLLLYLVCYSTSIMAVCLTGNLVVSVLGSVVLFVYSLILVVLKNALMEKFFMTYSGSASSGGGIWAFSPFHLFFNTANEMDQSSWMIFSSGEYWVFFGKLILMLVVYTVAALYLYKIRPTEAAGQSIAFAVTEPVIKTMVVFPVSIFGGYFFSGIISGSGSMGWFVFGSIFAFLIVCPVMEIIFRKDIKAMISHPLQIVFNGACVIVTLVIFHFDVFGYDSYIPDEDKVASYAINLHQLSTIYSVYGNSHTYRLDNMEIADNESTRKLLEHAVEISRSARIGELDELAEAGEVQYYSMEVRYNLKNGKSVYRNYLMNIKDTQVKQWLADTYNDTQHKLGVYPVLAENQEKEYLGVILEYPYDAEYVPLSEEKMQKFLDTYRRELMNLKFEELWTEYPVAQLSFAVVSRQEAVGENTYVTEEVRYMGDSFEAHDQEHGYEIYPSFTQTIALLEEYGAEFVSEIPVEDVISISVEDYALEVDDHDGLYDKVYVATYLPDEGQAEEAEQLLSVVVPNGCSGDFNREEKLEPYIDVRVRYYMDEIETSQNCSVKMGMLPAFVREDMKLAVE